ncbi:hypothetical protein C8J57DRAFT_1483244, partial [Mycena rebaudengoi]
SNPCLDYPVHAPNRRRRSHSSCAGYGRAVSPKLNFRKNARIIQSFTRLP